jgi:hypothetical protein
VLLAGVLLPKAIPGANLVRKIALPLLRPLEGEAEELVREAIDIAKAGDVVMLKFLLSRILPRERAIKLDLPAMNFADDAVAVLGAAFDAVTEGRITASEGAIDTYTRAIDTADVVKRLDFLESKINGGGR